MKNSTNLIKQLLTLILIIIVLSLTINIIFTIIWFLLNNIILLIAFVAWLVVYAYKYDKRKFNKIVKNFK